MTRRLVSVLVGDVLFAASLAGALWLLNWLQATGDLYDGWNWTSMTGLLALGFFSLVPCLLGEDIVNAHREAWGLLWKKRD